MTVVEMLSNPIFLLQLIEQEIHVLLIADEKLQQFLSWVNLKSYSVKSSYKISTIRAFYFALYWELDRPFTLSSIIEDTTNDVKYLFERSHSLSLLLDPTFDRDLDIGIEEVLSSEIFPDDLAIDFSLFLAYRLAHEFPLATGAAFGGATNRKKINLMFREKLEELKKELPFSCSKISELSLWKQDEGIWASKLKHIMVIYRDIGHEWEFSQEQISLLQQYYDANQILVHCLNFCSTVSQVVRQEIEDTLLLPIAEVKKRQRKNVE